MQMLQNTAVCVFQRRRYGRLKEIGLNQAADQGGFVIGVLHNRSSLARIKRTGQSYHKIL